MNCPLMTLIAPPFKTIQLSTYFTHCKSQIANPECFAPLKKGILQNLGLACSSQAGGNTCFSNAEEVLPGYRVHYSPEELFYFLLYSSHILTSEELAEEGVLAPQGNEAFWKSVSLGKQMEKDYLIDNMNFR